jgi:hypothetical protein
MKRALLALGFSIGAFGAVTANVSAVSSTQAIIQIQGANGSACLVEVATDAAFSNLVPDVNSTLFSGANLTSRSVTGYTFVAGTRTTAQAASNIWYSRALANNTTHYWRVNQNGACGSGAPTGTFITKTIPMGRLYNDAVPLHQPQLTGRGSTVDPQTGAVIQGVQAPGDSANSIGSATAFATPVPDVGATWTCSGGGGALPCAYSSTNQAKLFLPIALSTGQIQWNYEALANAFLVYIQAHITASVGTGTVPLNGCLTINGVTCITGTLTNTITTTPTAYTYGGTNFNWSDWGGDGTIQLDPPHVAQRVGGTATNSGGVLTLTGNPTWLPP